MSATRKRRVASKRPVICARLKPGWRYDSRKRRFVASTPQTIEDGGRPSLPRYTRIRPMIPELSDLAPETLSDDERRLARTVHLLLPRGSDPSAVLKNVVGWSFVASAWLSPTLSPAAEG